MGWHLTIGRVQTSSRAHPVFIQEKGDARHVHLMQKPGLHGTSDVGPIIPSWHREDFVAVSRISFWYTATKKGLNLSL